MNRLYFKLIFIFRMSASQSKKKPVVRRTKIEMEKSDELFVKLVQENKELLFGGFSPTVTAALKSAKWEEIRKAMVEEGDKLLATKDAAYTQTKYWQDVRKRTVERVDALKVTTGAEPKDDELSAVIFKVLAVFI